MSESMVERVAREIAGPAHAAPWGATGKQNWEMYTTEARAAIKAMREPTKKMRGAAVRAKVPPGGFTRGYQAMIDAALDEKEPTP